MATNLAIDPALLDRALQVSGERTKEAAVTKALQEFGSAQGTAARFGSDVKVGVDPTYDDKAERSCR